MEKVYKDQWDFLEQNKGIIKHYTKNLFSSVNQLGFENYLTEKVTRIWNTTRILNGYVITNAFTNYFKKLKFDKLTIHEELDQENLENVETMSYKIDMDDMLQTSQINGILYRYEQKTGDLKTIGTIKTLIKRYPTWNIKDKKDRNSWNYCMNKIKGVIANV